MNIQTFYNDLLLASFLLAAIVFVTFLPRLTGGISEKGGGRKSAINSPGL